MKVTYLCYRVRKKVPIKTKPIFMPLELILSLQKKQKREIKMLFR